MKEEDRGRFVGRQGTVLCPVIPIEGATFRNDYPYYEGSSSYHGATDLGANLGTPILSAFSGVIVESQQHWSYGVNIVVESTINGKQYRAIYAYLQSENAIAWDVGQQVHADEILGYVGMTGNTTGPHLHFEVREYPYKYKSNNVDPREFWEK